MWVDTASADFLLPCVVCICNLFHLQWCNMVYLVFHFEGFCTRLDFLLQIYFHLYEKSASFLSGLAIKYMCFSALLSVL